MFCESQDIFFWLLSLHVQQVTTNKKPAMTSACPRLQIYPTPEPLTGLLKSEKHRTASLSLTVTRFYFKFIMFYWISLAGNKQSSVPLSRPPEQNNQCWQEGQNFLTLTGMLLVKVVFFFFFFRRWESADLNQKSDIERRHDPGEYAGKRFLDSFKLSGLACVTSTFTKTPEERGVTSDCVEFSERSPGFQRSQNRICEKTGLANNYEALSKQNRTCLSTSLIKGHWLIT